MQNLVAENILTCDGIRTWAFPLFLAISLIRVHGDTEIISPGASLSPEDKLSSTLAPSLSLPQTAGTGGASSALHLARQDFRAVVIQNGALKGQILAVGGCSLASAELFNPEDSTWHATGKLEFPRWLFQAEALPNGPILAFGGLSITRGGVLNTTEVYLPSADSDLEGTWTRVADMNTARQDFAAVLLDDGSVLAAGGFMASAEVYNPAKDRWDIVESMRDARSAFELVKLAQGKVLAVGGRGRDSSVLASTELYDPTIQTWTLQGNLTQARASFALALLESGKVLVAGGRGPTGRMLNSSEIYDPSTGLWSPAPDMVYHRSLQQAVTLPSGRVLMVGGLGGLGPKDSSILDSAEMYDPTNEAWELTEAMVKGRYVFQLVSLPNGTAMAVGGTGLQGFTSSTELFMAA